MTAKADPIHRHAQRFRELARQLASPCPTPPAPSDEDVDEGNSWADFLATLPPDTRRAVESVSGQHKLAEAMLRAGRLAIWVVRDGGLPSLVEFWHDSLEPLYPQSNSEITDFWMRVVYPFIAWCTSNAGLPQACCTVGAVVCACKAIAKLLDQTPESSVPAHNDDFTSVDWFGTPYRFSPGQQASSVRALWNAWTQGHDVFQETIRIEIQSTAENRFELRKVFRKRTAGRYEYHKAWGTMIQSTGRGRVGLVPPALKKTPKNPR